MLNPHILKIIEKHIGSKIYLVYKDEGTFKLITCTLRNMNAEKVLVKDLNSSLADQTIPFLENSRPKILAIYNANGVNLINPTNNETLAMKLKKRDKQGIIIGNMKPKLKHHIAIVFKTAPNFYLVNGELSNMGMVDLKVKPAPFYNEERNIVYNHVMHVFDEFGNDLIDV